MTGAWNSSWSTRNRQRHYSITEARTLFGELCLVIVWGRIGRCPRVRTEVFTTYEDLTKRRNELLERRRQHGYVNAATCLGDERAGVSCAAPSRAE